jgi:hypothetical protein
MTTNVCQSAMGWLAKIEQKVLQVYTVEIYIRKRELQFPKKMNNSTQIATYGKTFN